MVLLCKFDVLLDLVEAEEALEPDDDEDDPSFIITPNHPGFKALHHRVL